MSVIFDIHGMQWPRDVDGCSLPPARMFVNPSNVNAVDFLRWIGLWNADLCGEIPAPKLAAILRRRLWPSRRKAGDYGRKAQVTMEPGRVKVIDCGREPGRLAEYAVRLLALAEFAGNRKIFWG